MLDYKGAGLDVITAPPSAAPASAPTSYTVAPTSARPTAADVAAATRDAYAAFELAQAANRAVPRLPSGNLRSPELLTAAERDERFALRMASVKASHTALMAAVRARIAAAECGR